MTVLATAGPAGAAARADHAPAVPTALSTSPATACAADTAVGDGDVTLYAALSDPDGGTLGAAFEVTRHAGDHALIASSDRKTLTVPSGSTAVYKVPRATLETAAAGKITEFDWKVRASDGTRAGGWSTTCHFSFDPTRPGTPVVAQPGPATIGKPVTVTVTAGSGSLPATYSYQLNSGAPVVVAADASGGATFTVIPTQPENTLTVTGVSPGGNFGDATNVMFGAAQPQAAPDGDLTGDGVPDLLAVGGRDGLASGLWLAAGTGDGHVAAKPTDIGAAGDGSSTTGSPSDFDGTIAITGHFADEPEQDVLVYHPSGPRAGTGAVYKVNGGGLSNIVDLSSGMLQDANGDNPTQLVNAGSVSGGTSGFPDLIGVSGDSTHGYGLTLYQGSGGAGMFGWPVPLTAATPDGTHDWDQWTIATAQVPASGGGSSTAMFLWRKSTGELDLWENLSADPDTGALTHTSYSVATGWNTGADLDLDAADINGDGVPDLWTVGAGGAVTANLVSGLSAAGPAVLTRVTGTLDTSGQ
ncbi:hypothetical protein [Streptomyces sp. ICBB 8177]|uniref:hypothetical protein n=1 Tax=Streptomyces sp. ICBB 8177 TaxID=563922 RepID=UPI000D67656A|nr:hypothetical protein [Streptomyces sp. ICBB 8177]PWI43793.1 hypothetical protein CK485_17020 [Streptomyces sp. ICBB 8177]